MRTLVCIALALSSTPVFAQLTPWGTWCAAQPSTCRQVPPSVMVIKGIGTNNYYPLEADPATGDIPVSLSGGSIAIDFSGATGSPVPADAGYFGGNDGGTLRGIAVDSSGNVQTDIVAALPAGTNNIGDVDVVSSVLPTGAATETTLSDVLTDTGNISSNTSGILSDTTTIAGTVVGSEMQVDVVAALPAGTNNIGDVDVTNFPATVSTNSGASDASTLRVTQGSRTYADSASYSYAGGNVTTGAWTEVDASTAAAINLICITDTSGQVMELGSGAAASESRIFLIAQGFSGCIPLRIAASTRLAVRAVTATASSGYLTLSGMN